MVGAVEGTLFFVSALVVVVGLAGMLVALLTGLSERRRETERQRAGPGAEDDFALALVVARAAPGAALGPCNLPADGLPLGHAAQ